VEICLRYALRLLLFISTVFLTSQEARSEEGDFTGQWKQTYSDAGSCEECPVGIVRQGRLMTISSNSGWSATAETSSNGNVSYAEGTGHWNAHAGEHNPGAFSVFLAIRDNRLMIIMGTEGKDRSKQKTKMLFERRPEFSYDRT